MHGMAVPPAFSLSDSFVSPFPFIHVLKVYLNRRLFSFLFLRNFSILLLFSCCSDFRNQQFLKQFFLPVGVLFFRQVRNPAHDRLFLREYIASLTPFSPDRITSVRAHPEEISVSAFPVICLAADRFLTPGFRKNPLSFPDPSIQIQLSQFSKFMGCQLHSG